MHDGLSPLRIRFLCEGDAETYDSWSGVSRSVVRHLRGAGHQVSTADMDVHGLRRGILALRTVSRTRRRWWVRYHLGAAGFRARSDRCVDHFRNVGADIDAILQVGATFEVPTEVTAPIILYCDSNIELARRAIQSGVSEAAALTESEIDAIRAQESRVYARADLIFTMSDLLRKSFIDDFGVSAERLVTVHCGPNFELDEAGTAARDRTPPPTILFVGRDPHRKGADLLLAAFSTLKDRLPTARLTMVGPPPDRRAPPGVEYLGYLDRDTAQGREAMDNAYRDASVFCLPTRYDPFGTSFVEAMAYGLPCVGPAAWAVPEIIEDGRTGFVVSATDPREIAAALLRLLTDHELTTRMGQAARERVLTHFTWPMLTTRMTDAMRSVLRD